MQHGKIVVPIAILLLLIILAGAMAGRFLTVSSERLGQQISSMEDSIKNGDWKSAEDHLAAIVKDWAQTGDRWSILIDHGEIDNIDVALSRITRLVEVRDMPLVLAEASALKQYVKHIPEKEMFLVKNIF